MSQQTCIVFFTTAKISNAPVVIHQVLDLIEPSYNDVTRYNGIDESWRFRHEDHDALDFDFLCKRVDQAEAAKLYQKGKLLVVQGVSKVQQAIRKAIVDNISPDIYG